MNLLLYYTVTYDNVTKTIHKQYVYADADVTNILITLLAELPDSDLYKTSAISTNCILFLLKVY